MGAVRFVFYMLYLTVLGGLGCRYVVNTLHEMGLLLDWQRVPVIGILSFGSGWALWSIVQWSLRTRDADNVSDMLGDMIFGPRDEERGSRQ